MQTKGSTFYNRFLFSSKSDVNSAIKAYNVLHFHT